MHLPKISTLKNAAHNTETLRRFCKIKCKSHKLILQKCFHVYFKYYENAYYNDIYITFNVLINLFYFMESKCFLTN